MQDNKPVVTADKLTKNLTYYIKKTIIFLLKATAFIAIVLGLSYGLSLLGGIHGQELPENYFNGGYPMILGMLNSELFMGLIFLITLSIIVYVLYLLWQLHEVAVHKAEAYASPQIQLVFALSLCGLFIDKTWWVLAIIITFTSWEHIGEHVSKVIRGETSTNTNTEGAEK